MTSFNLWFGWELWAKAKQQWYKSYLHISGTNSQDILAKGLLYYVLLQTWIFTLNTPEVLNNEAQCRSKPRWAQASDCSQPVWDEWKTSITPQHPVSGPWTKFYWQRCQICGFHWWKGGKNIREGSLLMKWHRLIYALIQNYQPKWYRVKGPANSAHRAINKIKISLVHLQKLQTAIFKENLLWFSLSWVTLLSHETWAQFQIMRWGNALMIL